MKRIIMWIVILGIAGGLTACGDEGSGRDAEKKENPASEAAVQKSGSGQRDAKNDMERKTGKLHMLLNPQAQESIRCINDNGYYYISSDAKELKDGHYGKHLMYMDFATQREIYLCSASGCRHNTEECTAVLSDRDFPEMVQVFCQGDSLYVLSTGYDKSGSTEMNLGGESGEREPEIHPAVLYCMGLDGSGRRKVYTFEEGMTVEDTVWESEGGLFFITKKTGSRKLGKNQGRYTYPLERKIVKLDTASWKLDPVYPFELSDKAGEWKVIGCHKDSLVLSALCFDHALTDEEMLADDRETNRNILKKSKNQIALLNLNTRSLKVVYERFNKSGKLSDQIYGDGFLYLTEEDDPKIRQMDLDTGKTSTLARLKNKSFIGIYKDMICCSDMEATEDQTLYFVNRKNGEISHCGLVTKTLGWMLDIKGEIKDKFLVVYDYDATPGIDDGYEISRYYHALISKEDLYQGKENYLPIKMTGKGE